MGNGPARSATMTASAWRCAVVSVNFETRQEPGHQRVALGAGDLEGRDVMANRAGVVLEGPSAQHQGELQPPEFVEDEPSAGLVDRFGGFGSMDDSKRCRAIQERERRPPRRRERVGEFPGAAQCLFDKGPNLPTGQTRLGRGRIDRQDAQRPAALSDGRLVDTGDHVDDRIDHLARAPVFADFPPENGLGSFAQLAAIARAG